VVRNERGITLTELLVAVAISAGFVGAMAGLMSMMFSDLKFGNVSLGFAQDRTVLQKVLTRRLTMSNIHSFALTDSATDGDTHGRAISVVPSFCADRTSGPECDQSTLLQFNSVDHSISIPVAAYCWDQVANALVVDVSIENLLAAPGETRDIVGLISPPIMTSWRVTGVSTLNLTDVNTGAPLSPQCQSKIPREPSGQIDQNKYRRITVSPITLKGTAPAASPAQQIRYNEVFPQRVTRLNSYSAGLVRSPTNSQRMNFVIYACSFSNAAGYACGNSAPLATIEHIRGNYIVERFRTKMPAKPQTVDFQITGAQITRRPSCNPPKCDALPVVDYTNIPYRTSTNETPETLDANQFSLIKQEVLGGISLILVDRDDKEQAIHFSFD
jgi:hypothetical protein